MVEQHRGKSIDDLLAEIDAAWQRLMATMTAHPEDAYTEKRDQVGWNALDHLAHVTAWERSVLSPLRGGSRHEGIGLTDEEFSLDFDEQNQILRDRTAGQAYAEAMADAREVHEAVVEALRQTEIDELWRPSRELADDQRERDNARPFMAIVMSDACEHFDEHRAYIETILAG